jgi:hypothetical protein
MEMVKAKHEAEAKKPSFKPQINKTSQKIFDNLLKT